MPAPWKVARKETACQILIRQAAGDPVAPHPCGNGRAVSGPAALRRSTSDESGTIAWVGITGAGVTRTLAAIEEVIDHFSQVDCCDESVAVEVATGDGTTAIMRVGVATDENLGHCILLEQMILERNPFSRDSGRAGQARRRPDIYSLDRHRAAGEILRRNEWSRSRRINPRRDR